MIQAIRPLDLLDLIAHRPSPLPSGRWNFFQEWHEAAFLHYQVDLVTLRTFVPKELELDLYLGKAWVSVVAFTMRNVRPRWLPAFSPVSDFHEVNIRTYVKDQSGNVGVYFLRIDAGKWASVALARILSALPYRMANIHRGMDHGNWFEARTQDGMHLKFKLHTGDLIPSPTDLDRWLVERYALFERYRKSTWCYEIHHLPWPLQTVDLRELHFTPAQTILPLKLSNGPVLAHWSEGVRLLSWPRKKITE